MSNTLVIILIVICILLSSLFSMTEISFSSANKFKLKSNYEKNEKKYRLAYKFNDNFTNTISTILVGNNLVNIATSSLATILFIKYFGEELGPTYSTIIITLIVLVFGEILPKLLGNKYANSLIVPLSIPFTFFDIIFKPITFIVNKFINLISPIWTPKEIEPSLTDDELIDIIEDLEESNEIDEDKSDLIRNAIEFSDTTAYDIMIPRIEVVGYDIEDDINEFVKDPELLSHSFIIVYKESLDNIIGYVDIKDIMRCIYLKKKININGFIKHVYYVNETKKIDDLLVEMKENKAGMVVVVDEFGGTDGIIKSEDILEELVGDIWDEKDKVEYEYNQIDDNEYIVDGDMDIYDLFDELEIDRDDFESEYSTVSGYMSEILDKIPEKNDEIRYKNLILKVVKADETSALKIKATVINEDEDN